MSKTITKKATSPKKTKTVAKKKIQKTVKKVKSETPKKLNYPLWTLPEHLNEKDRKSLKRFYELFTQKKFEVALNFAADLDTIVRDQIPSDIWIKTGGKLTKVGEEDLAKASETSKTSHLEVVCPELDEIPIPNEIPPQKPNIKETTTESITGSDVHPESVELNFKFGELEQLVLTNSKSFFGENTLLFKNENDVKGSLFPDKFLLDFSNSEKPRLYLVEAILTGQNFAHCFVRITHYFALLRNKKNHDELMWKLHAIVNSNSEQKNELQDLLQKHVEIPEFISTVLVNKPLVLLITDGEKSEISLFTETYTETWGKMLKTLIIRKYESEGKTTYPVCPAFADLLKNDKSKPEVIKSTEADHLLATSETVRSIYNEIKTALLEADNSIEFNAKKIYISIRKNKNLAFFHLRKKISLVVMNPEDDTSMQIQHHEIKTLPASVQKFWNGSCCTIVIENSVNLDEVINLLKKMIAKA